MGFNRRKLEDQRREAAEKEAANRRATDAQVLEDVERLIAAWNERQAKRTLDRHHDAAVTSLIPKEGGPNARLDSHLPAWLLRDIITKAVRTRLI
jgi:hypothetical protein